jgi:hypothetical protein
MLISCSINLVDGKSVKKIILKKEQQQQQQQFVLPKEI